MRKSSKQNDKQVNNDVSRASSVRSPKQSSVIWKKKGSSNTSNVDLSYVSHSKLNKDVKRYSRKDLLSCNNSHLGDTSYAYVCNDSMNVSCNFRLCDLFDENNLFIFDDERVRISPVSKIPFRKKPHDSLNVRFKRCSKHMTGNRALLTNFVERFLGTVRFGNNDFVVIAGYGDVVIGLMTIKKVYYIEGLGQNLFSVGKFYDKGLEVPFRKSTCFVRNEDGVDLLTGDRSSNFYTIALNEVASNSSTSLLAKASSSQSWLWHQRLSHLNFATINNLVKNNLVQENPSESSSSSPACSTDNGTEFKNKTLAKFFDEVGITQQFSAARTPQQNGVVERRNQTLVEAARTMLTFANLPSMLESARQKGIGVFVGYSKEYAAFRIYSKLNSSEEVRVPSSNTQSVSNSMVPNVDEVSTSHNVFNERLEDAYFDASTSFHDPSNVHTFYQPYPHEKKWTKDHPLHKIIGDSKLSVRTRGQLANSCLFSCLLSSIMPANMAEALRDANWVSAMQDELDQFARLKVWILVPRPEGKTIIKTKWIFKNKKD
nr:integrase, catalytic region, zinc finger, CCHC-type, peptidase aspartic, catalytic [Tanacetum cinerariifolium]